MFKSMKCCFAVLMCLLLTGCAVKNPPKTMNFVNIEQYMGTWYEIASLPAPFQKHCFCTMAQYRLQGDKVKITNSCRKGSVEGEWSIAHATGRVVPQTNNSQLKITFFWPFVANYWILYVSPDYQTAIVGTPDRKYLWLLARHKTISEKSYKNLLSMASSKGYSLRELHKTQQCV